MIKIEMIKIDESVLVDNIFQITFAFFPKRGQEQQIKNYYKDTKQFQDIYDENFEFTDTNISIMTLVESEEEKDLLIEAVRTKNLTSILMQSNHNKDSVKCLCETVIKFFDLTEAVL